MAPLTHLWTALLFLVHRFPPQRPQLSSPLLNAHTSPPPPNDRASLACGCLLPLNIAATYC
eukprot:363611-Chlamydomonas_euryale.AAC.22